MIKVDLNRLADSQKVTFEIDLKNPFDAEGGEGTIYKSILAGKVYVIKPIELNDETKRKYKDLNNRIKTINSSDILKAELKERVLHSFIPYAQNFHNGKLFGYESINKIDVFAYSFVEGKKLSQHLSDNIEIPIEERLDICVKLLDLLYFLQMDCGILHADIFEDNFIIDTNGNIFPIDSTSCGYFIWNHDNKKDPDYLGDIVYHPKNRGKAENWGLPIPKDFAEEGITSQYTDRYFTARLVWRILTNQIHPYTFLTRVDATSLEDLIYCVDVNKSQSWPPKFDTAPDYIDESKYAMYESYMEEYFGTKSKIAKDFFNYFIKGYETPKSRPPLKFLRDKLYKTALELNQKFKW